MTVNKEPSKEYLLLLKIKEIIRKWQYFDLNDDEAIRNIISACQDWRYEMLPK